MLAIFRMHAKELHSSVRFRTADCAQARIASVHWIPYARLPLRPANVKAVSTKNDANKSFLPFTG